MVRRYAPHFALAAAVLFAALSAAPSFRSGPDLPLLFASDFENGRADGWAPRASSRWQIGLEDGSRVYRLVVPGEPGPVRAPMSWSIVQDLDLGSFVFTGRLKCKAEPANAKRDMCVFLRFQDSTHFAYVHFSASSDEVHNIIGLVNGVDRVKINREPAGASVFRLTDLRFHDFKVTSDAASGEIRAYLDDMETPILTAVDRTFGRGRVGVGSFDDTGSFDDLKIWGERTNDETPRVHEIGRRRDRRSVRPGCQAASLLRGRAGL